MALTEIYFHIFCFHGSESNRFPTHLVEECMQTLFNVHHIIHGFISGIMVYRGGGGGCVEGQCLLSK